VFCRTSNWDGLVDLINQPITGTLVDVTGDLAPYRARLTWLSAKYHLFVTSRSLFSFFMTIPGLFFVFYDDSRPLFSFFMTPISTHN